jgi:hypothetical protein
MKTQRAYSQTRYAFTRSYESSHPYLCALATPGWPFGWLRQPGGQRLGKAAAARLLSKYHPLPAANARPLIAHLLLC